MTVRLSMNFFNQFCGNIFGVCGTFCGVSVQSEVRFVRLVCDYHKAYSKLEQVFYIVECSCGQSTVSDC